MKQYFDYCFKYGKNAEKRFVEKYLTNINYPTKNQDIYEHWDVEGTLKSINNNKYKFDIKSSGKLKYSTENNIMDSVWVEGTNISGKQGWIKGRADYIVFERENTWFVIDRQELLNFTFNKLKENNFKKGKGVYLIHTRAGRKDKVTQVLFEDMKKINNYYELNK
jgi:hypothetical protein